MSSTLTNRKHTFSTKFRNFVRHDFYYLEDIDLGSSNLHAIEIFSHTISHKNLVILAIIRAELARGGKIQPPPPSRARNSEPHSRARVKLKDAVERRLRRTSNSSHHPHGFNSGSSTPHRPALRPQVSPSTSPRRGHSSENTTRPKGTERDSACRPPALQAAQIGWVGWHVLLNSAAVYTYSIAQ